MIYIKKVKIESLFGYRDLDIDINKDVTVVVGKNGKGKSTLLNIIRAIMTNQYSEELSQCKYAEIELTNGSVVSAKRELSSSDQILDLIKHLKKQRSDGVNADTEIDVDLLDVLKEKMQPKINNNNETKDIAIDFISTVNMSSNSIVKMTSSDGTSQNILNLEIDKEINKFFQCEPDKIHLFVETINELLKDSGKEIGTGKKSIIFQMIHDDKAYLSESRKNSCNQYLYVKDLQNDNKKLTIKDLSSGERQLIYIFLKAINSSHQKSILLMDEPEISLQLYWQEKLISSIRKLSNNAQIIIVTHSPAIVMDGWMDSFVQLD